MAVADDKLEIPKELQEQFRRLDRRLWWVDTTLALSGALSALLVSYLVLFVSDRFWDTPQALRALLVLGGFAGATYFVWGWVEHWILERRDQKILAGIVQGHYRRLGDRLLGIVELADERTPIRHGSPELCRAAIAQVASEALPLDFRKAVQARRARLLALGALWFLLLVMAPGLLMPEAFWNTLSRWFWPASAVERYTFVRLEDVPSTLVVAHGEPFEIACSVRWHPFWKPGTATGQVDGQPAIHVTVRGGRVVFPIPGQTSPGTLRLKVGDERRQIALEPKLRPALMSLRAEIQFPEYLQSPKTSVDIARGELTYLENSRVALRGRTSRTLAEAGVRWERGNFAGSQGTFETIPLEVRGESFETQLLDLGGRLKAAFTWRDEWGLTSAAPWTLTFHPAPDQRPQVDCPEQASVVAMLEEEILEIRTLARDDYGIRQLAMAWECRPRHDTNLVAKATTPVAEGAPDRKQIEARFVFSPALFRLPADTVVTLRAVASDYFPDRAPGESAPFQIFILSQAEHARLVQQEMERVLSEVEDVARRQESLKSAGQALAGVPEALESQDSGRQLAEQAREQEALSAKLNQMAQRMSDTLREAMRNRSIPAEFLESWARMAETMRQLGQGAMLSAASKLSRAERNGAERETELGEALKLEEEALRALLELQQQIGPALDRMMSNTLAQRLRQVARKEAELNKALQSLLPEIIGVRPERLTRAHQDTLGGLGSRQDQAQREGGSLQQEISRFYDRTSETNYGAVAKAMKDLDMVTALGGVAALVRSNVAAIAMSQAGIWETRFNQWAEQLEQANLESGGGGEGGGGGMSEAALRRLLALLRLRQYEEGIRNFTKILEQRRETSRSYREDAILLSIRQNFVVKDTRELMAGGQSTFLPEAAKAMSDSEQKLVVPQTDAPVVEAQTDAINLLEAEILDMLKSAQGSSMAAAMAMMMQRMGMNPAGGGSLAGGATDQPNRDTEGEVNRGALESRDSERAAGRSTRTVPVEFREALRHYFRALEQIEANPPREP